MAKAANPIPAGFRSLTAHLSVKGAAKYFPEFGSPPIAEGHWPMVLHLYVPDADATFAKAVAADPFGFTWAIATHMEDLTPEEMQQRQAKAFGGGAGA